MVKIVLGGNVVSFSDLSIYEMTLHAFRSLKEKFIFVFTFYCCFCYCYYYYCYYYTLSY